MEFENWDEGERDYVVLSRPPFQVVIKSRVSKKLFEGILYASANIVRFPD